MLAERLRKNVSNYEIIEANHFAFAAKRVLNGIVISNPLTHDIVALFPDEYEVARKAQEMQAARIVRNCMRQVIGHDVDVKSLSYCNVIHMTEKWLRASLILFWKRY